MSRRELVIAQLSDLPHLVEPPPVKAAVARVFELAVFELAG